MKHLNRFYYYLNQLPVIETADGPALGKATSASMFPIKASTLLTEADAVGKATGFSGILKPKIVYFTLINISSNKH